MQYMLLTECWCTITTPTTPPMHILIFMDVCRLMKIAKIMSHKYLYAYDTCLAFVH